VSNPADSIHAPLVDGFGRVHTDLRLSVTDHCNIRCVYCMPAENARFQPRSEILTFDELERFVRVAARLGVVKLRLTGGEPLLRENLHQLVARLVRVPGIREIALTTNGVFLTEQARDLRQAGLERLNISLQALDPEVYQRITRRDVFEQVLSGIFAARDAGFQRIKLNTVAMRGVSEDEILPLARFAREHDFELRFIEFMPLDADRAWTNDRVIAGEEIRELIEEQIGALEALDILDASQPATEFRFVDGCGRIGFINSVTQPFCGDCNRLRLTAEGQVRNCLFGIDEWDARGLMRRGGSDEQLAELLRACVAAKRAGHGINSDEFLRPSRAMFQIGG
jgi:cyclic pyranopterin phosphate synthase